MPAVRVWLLLLLLSPALASAELLRLVANPWPPFNDQELPGKGLASDLVEQALKGATKAAELTHRLLAFSRRQNLVPSVIDPNALVAVFNVTPEDRKSVV